MMEQARSRIQIQVPVSAGELFDKKTILEIKRDRISDTAQRVNVLHELELLTEIAKRVLASASDADQIGPLEADLKDINLRLWDLENLVRTHERQYIFDEDFVRTARSIYAGNDRRAAVKRQINTLLLSSIVEEKCHT